MRAPRSKPSAAISTALAVGLAGWLVAACAWQDEAQRAPQPTVEPEPASADVAEDHAGQAAAQSQERKGAPLRALATLEGADSGAGKDFARSQSARKLDARALSELEAKTSQSLTQRANETLDYLGTARFDDARARDEPHALVAPGKKAEGLPAAPPESGGRFDERNFFYKSLPARVDTEEDEELRGLRESRALDPRAALGDGASPLDEFERERRNLEGLTFQSPSGYWANTYVPGDPVMRWLESRLEKRDRSALQAFAAQPLLLEAGSRQTPQPFDAPSSAALSVFLQTDRRGLEGEGRLLLQVGLRGADRHSGTRPSMQVGIVFDLRGGVTPEVAQAMRGLMDGFMAARDVGDRFSLTVAGRPGGTLIEPEAFRHGPISLAMATLLEPAAARRPGDPLFDLEEAVRQTAERLRRVGDPEAPLGSSLVLLVTAQPLGSHTRALAGLAHHSAVAGVPLSVVGVGEQVSLDELEQVALAGQGNLRLMEAAAEAAALVERELSALNRVIARALRLRIRLAPGVRLVEVVGSEQLDTAGAERVRAAERSIDRRLARNLGIEADRGEDEAGIQIVIPTFHSGDSHAVLLDVVAPGPGPVADVTVRYKDLVYLRNGVARANLTLGRSSDPPGPLERNVTKNLLAIRLSEMLKLAGRQLLAGGDDEAIAAVRRFQTLLAEIRRELPGFQNDLDLNGDLQMLREYVAVLEAGALQQDAPREYLADSLQLSGYFKTVPRTSPETGVSRR